MSKTPSLLNKLSRRDRKRLRRQWRQLDAGLEVFAPHPYLHDAEMRLALEDEEMAKRVNPALPAPRSGTVVSEWKKPIQGYKATSVARSDNVGGTTFGHGTGTGFHFCRHAAEYPVVNLGQGTMIYAGARSDTLRSVHDWKLIIDLSGISADSAYAGPAEYDSLRQFVSSDCPQMSVDWPDYGLPPVRFGFWEELVKLLPKGDVLVRCFGGHGRTGTAIAALLIIAWDYDAATAIATIRKHHCEQAVESANQKRYLAQLSNWWRAKNGQPVTELETEDEPALALVSPSAVNDPKWMCETCNEVFEVLEDCITHGEIVHHLPAGKAFQNADYVGSQSDAADDLYDCPACTQTFTDAALLSTHRQTVHEAPLSATEQAIMKRLTHGEAMKLANK